MKSIERIKKEYKLTNSELLNAYHDAIRYYLSDEDLEPFLIKVTNK